MVQEHKIGPVYGHQFTNGNLANNTIVFRFVNTTDDVWRLTRVVLFQSTSNNVETNFNVRIRDQAGNETVTTNAFSYPASTLGPVTFRFANPFVIPRGGVLEIYPPTAGTTPMANVSCTAQLV